MISPDLVPFLESGLSVLLGTRDGRLFPDCARGIGVRVEPGGEEITVYLPEATCAAILANLEINGRLAVCFANFDHRSLQVKGQVVDIRPADDEDYAVIDRYRHALKEMLAVVGVNPRHVLRLAHRPSRAVRLRVETIFQQTPGPHAGDPLAAPRGPR